MPEQPPPNAADVAVLIIGLGALLIGLISVLIGHIAALYDWLRGRGVKSFRGSSPRPGTRNTAGEQTDEADRPTDRALESRLSEKKIQPPRLQLNKTRAAVIEELLTHGWTVADLRREGILRGDNKVIGDEVAEARKRLGLADAERTLRVRDAAGERVIPFSPDPRFRDLDKEGRPILR